MYDVHKDEQESERGGEGRRQDGEGELYSIFCNTLQRHGVEFKLIQDYARVAMGLVQLHLPDIHRYLGPAPAQNQSQETTTRDYSRMIWLGLS
ncbi:hypothetical protein LTR27_012664 [Elasticomyces elasticus]|nr:hypothetical protein LTR27_012664 [Elasticomyces elasticus]